MDRVHILLLLSMKSRVSVDELAFLQKASKSNVLLINICLRI